MNPALYYLPGAGPVGEQAGRLAALLAACDVTGLSYPDWRTLARQPEGLEATVEDIARTIVATPEVPVVLVGYSLGAQIGWRVASRLVDMARPPALFVAIDGRVVTADRPDRGWVARAAVDLRGSAARGELGVFLTSRLSRLIFRTAGRRLPQLAGGWAAKGLPAILRKSTIFQSELTMRLLIAAAAGMSGEGSFATPLQCPALLVRTAGSGERDDFWRAKCPGIRIAEVEAGHTTIIRSPAFEMVVQQIRRALEEAVGTPG